MSKKTVVVVLASVMTLLMYLTPAAYATGSSQSNTVIFGDSILANPAYLQLSKKVAPPLTKESSTSSTYHSGYSHPGAPSPQGCDQGEHTIGRHLDFTTSTQVIDYSCPGTTAVFSPTNPSIQTQVDGAIAYNHLNATTDNVIIMVGLNDIRSHKNDTSYDEVVAKELTYQINRIKKAAPQARVITMSYPAISAPGGQVCPVRIVSAPGIVGMNMDILGSLPIDMVGTFRNAELRADNAIWRASQASGVEFFDLNEHSKFNNMCASNKMRWISAVIDFALPHNVNNHLTHQGINGITDIIATRVLHLR